DAEAGAAPHAARVQPPHDGLLIEVAWEVVNPIGGIFQVIRSKAPSMVERWGDRYCLVGPYSAQQAALEFEESAPFGPIGDAVSKLRAEGLNARFGRWMIAGRPLTVLIDHWQGTQQLDATKYRLFRDHAISTPPGDGLLDGVITFADAVLRLFKAVGETGRAGKVLGHFHEWMAGLAIPMIRHNNLPVATVFTTHATLLGRYLAGNDDEGGSGGLYDRLAWGTVDQAGEAQRYNIVPQHSIERACAHGAHVMTTVSDITGEECDGLLGRAPDVVLPNGLDIQRYNVGHEFQTLHAQFKEKIHQFVMGHFFGSYAFDLDRTIYVFTSGRYEPRNKGFDLSVEAMARLNAELKAANLGVTVVFFIITRRPTTSLHPWALQQRGVLNEFRSVCDHIMSELSDSLFKIGATGARVDLEKLIDEYWVLRYRRTQQALKVDRLPLVTTHMIDGEDPVINQIRNVWLFNRKDDPVKVVYHPDFISPTSPLWGMEYEEFVRGCHLGVFPSAYEPWGYTPLEAIAMGVPAMSSDLAGFGTYVSKHLRWQQGAGLWNIHRRGKGFGDAAGEMARYLLQFCKLDRRGRISMRNNVEAHSWLFDWGNLSAHYHRAHELAMERAFG
ncbi:MAG: glycosyltransferase, partial [Phycisphaerales bacterium]|nr:glycosyltransferase [Phycisphaerales bacterium]